MSSCSNSTHIGLFRQRETLETDVSKRRAISLSVFPAKDISQAVKIIFVFERRIVNSSRKCENLAFQPSTPLILHYITLLVKLFFKKMQFFAIKMHDSSKKVRNSSKACKMDCDFCDGSRWSYKSQFRNSPLPLFVWCNGGDSRRPPDRVGLTTALIIRISTPKSQVLLHLYIL